MDINIALDSFVTEKNSYYGKNQTKYSFPNGYGASVISGEGIRQFELLCLTVRSYAIQPLSQMM